MFSKALPSARRAKGRGTELSIVPYRDGGSRVSPSSWAQAAEGAFIHWESTMKIRHPMVFALLFLAIQLPAVARDSAAAASQYEADRKLCAQESDPGARMQCLRDAKAVYDKAVADTSSAKTAEDAYKAAQERVEARYAADKKLCAQESTSSVRMQCLRDANAEYNKALAGAKGAPESVAKPSAVACADCGKVVGVTAGKRDGDGPLGALTGVRFWSVLIKLDSGALRTVEFDRDPGVKSGDLVKVSGNTVTAR